jgi:hypothetical protein
MYRIPETTAPGGAVGVIVTGILMVWPGLRRSRL